MNSKNMSEKFIFPFFVSLIIFSISLDFVNCDFINGAISVTAGTIEKVIKHHKVVVIRFDDAYASGPKHDAFKQFADSSLNQPDLIVADFGISEFGMIEKNSVYANEHGIKSSDFPVIRLYKDGTLKNKFTGDVTADNLKMFVNEETGLWLGLPGCLKEYDDLVKDFFKCDEKQKNKIYEETKLKVDSIESKTEKRSATVYLGVIKKILEKGNGFIDTEITRVKKLMEGKMSSNKKDQLQERVNILSSFKKSHTEFENRDEL